MAQVTVTIAGKTYRMACDDGQEDHLLGLAGRLDAMIDDMRRQFGEIGDQRLTVMAAITLIDRLAESERRIDALETDVGTLAASRDAIAERERQTRQVLAARLGEAAQRIAALADRLAGRREPG